MPEALQAEYEHEQDLFDETTFNERFSNFHLIFACYDDPEYRPAITAFLQAHYPEEAARMVAEIKGVSRPNAVKPELLSSFYDLYLKLRNEGGFSNRDLGLIYW